MSERWKSVGDQFAALKDSFVDRYDEADDAPDSDEVKDALTKIGDGLERLVSSIGGVARDDAFKQQAKSTMKSLADALSDSVSEIGVKAKASPGNGDAETPAADGGDANADPTGTDTSTDELREDLDM